MNHTEFPLTHRALVCSRMDLFKQLENVYALSTHGAIPPRDVRSLDQASELEAKAILESMFPVFLHNLIRDPEFPCREQLNSALEQMELNIRENAANPLVQELLTCGLKGEVFNAGGLPEKVDAKRAVSLFLARTEWDTLYRTFSLRVIKTLARERQQVQRWIDSHAADVSAA